MWFMTLYEDFTCNRRAQESLYYANGPKSLQIPLFSDKDAIQIFCPLLLLFSTGSHVVQAGLGLGSSCFIPFSAGITGMYHLILSPFKVSCSLVLRCKCSLYIQGINSLQDIFKIFSPSLWLLLINIIFVDLFVFHEFFINSHILLCEYNLLSWWTLGYFKGFVSQNSAVLLVNFCVHFLCIQFYSEWNFEAVEKNICSSLLYRNSKSEMLQNPFLSADRTSQVEMSRQTLCNRPQ